MLREWAPRGNAQVLVTTRLSGFSREVRTVDIEEWALPDAIRYLREESGRSDLTERDAADIAEALGRLPLALSHAAALLRDNVDHHLGKLCRDPDPAYERSASRMPNTRRAVFATFQEAIARPNARRAAPAL